MDTTYKTRCELPAWIRAALEFGDPTDNLPNKRAESRRAWVLLCLLTPRDKPNSAPITVRVTNVGPSGIGFISREVLTADSRVRLIPQGGREDEAVYGRIVHCTQTVQGFKVGCSIEPP